MNDLVDPRFGPITRVVRQPRPDCAPAAFTAYSTDVADTRAFAPWCADPFAFGASLTDPQSAKAAAIGEAIERYCGNAIPPALPCHSYRQLVDEGIAALDPATVILYSDEQYAQPGFPFVRFDPELPVRWVKGRDLSTDAPVLVPASLTYLNYYTGPYIAEPRTNFMIMPGMAAAPDRPSAVNSALAEMIERDAVTTWWQRGMGTTAIDAEPDGFPAQLLANPELADPLRYHLFLVSSDVGVPVIGALLDDREAGVVTMGSACHPQPRVAVAKALTEAIQLRSFSVDLTDQDSRVWRGFNAGDRDARALAPFRRDRAYLGDDPFDIRRAVDFATHAQLYLDPRMRVHVRRILDPARRARLPEPTQADLLDVLTDHGHRAIAVDLTTSDVARAGLHVVRVLVPGLYPNAPAAFPFLGGQRLYRPPGSDRPLAESELVRVPIPAI